MHYLLLLIIVFSSFKCKEKINFTKSDIIEFYTFTNTFDTIPKNKIPQYKVRRFIINNFELYNDTLIKEYTDSIYKAMDTINNQIDFVFYKASSITNIEHLNLHPKDLDRYSQDNDLVYILTKYIEAKDMFLTIYKKGEIISPGYKNIKIE